MNELEAPVCSTEYGHDEDSVIELLRKHEVSFFSFSTRSLCEKCPNTVIFLVDIFLYSDWIQENTDQRNLYLDTFHAVYDSVTSFPI